MALSFSEALNHSGHRLGDPSGSPDIDGLLVLNTAGQYLVQANDWTCLERGPVTFPVIDGQTEIEIPDLDRFLGGWFGTNTLSIIADASPGDFQEINRGFAEPVGMTLAAVIWNENAEGVPVPMLRMWPGVRGETSVSLYYRRGWTRVSGDTQTIAIPEILNPLYLELVRAVALGFEEPDIQEMGERVTRVLLSATFLIAKRTDARIQRSYGHVRGGAMARQLQHGGERYLNGTVDPPTTL